MRSVFQFKPYVAFNRAKGDILYIRAHSSMNEHEDSVDEREQRELRNTITRGFPGQSSSAWSQEKKKEKRREKETSRKRNDAVSLSFPLRVLPDLPKELYSCARTQSRARARSRTQLLGDPGPRSRISAMPSKLPAIRPFIPALLAGAPFSSGCWLLARGPIPREFIVGANFDYRAPEPRLYAAPLVRERGSRAAVVREERLAPHSDPVHCCATPRPALSRILPSCLPSLAIALLLVYSSLVPAISSYPRPCPPWYSLRKHSSSSL